MTAKRYARINKQIAQLEARAERIRKAALKGIISKVRGIMAEHGITLEDLGGKAPGKRGRPAKAMTAAPKRGRPAKAIAAKRGRPAKAKAAKPPTRKVQPKYQSPSDKKLTWTGRGRKPRWVQEWLDKGKELEGLLIK